MLLVVALGTVVGAGALVVARHRRAGFHGRLRVLDGADAG